MSCSDSTGIAIRHLSVRLLADAVSGARKRPSVKYRFHPVILALPPLARLTMATADSSEKNNEAMSDGRRISRSAQTRSARVAERIIVAGLDLLAGVGLDGMSMRQIATMSGVSRPTLYRHFPSMEDLIEGLFIFMINRFEEMLRQAIDDDPARESRLRVVASFMPDEDHRFSLQGLIRKEPGLALKYIKLHGPAVTALIEWALEPVFADVEKSRGVELDRTLIAEMVVRIQSSISLTPWGSADSHYRSRHVEALLLAVLHGALPIQRSGSAVVS